MRAYVYCIDKGFLVKKKRENGPRLDLMGNSIQDYSDVSFRSIMIGLRTSRAQEPT